jgi:hypothetical protein
VAWIALWRAFHQTRKFSFLMISPKLLDISPFFLLIFSPLGTADFLVLLELPGDGYSLLCSKKQPPRHNRTYVCAPQYTADKGTGDFLKNVIQVSPWISSIYPFSISTLTDDYGEVGPWISSISFLQIYLFLDEYGRVGPWIPQFILSPYLPMDECGRVGPWISSIYPFSLSTYG